MNTSKAAIIPSEIKAARRAKVARASEMDAISTPNTHLRDSLRTSLIGEKDGEFLRGCDAIMRCPCASASRDSPDLIYIGVVLCTDAVSHIDAQPLRYRCGELCGERWSPAGREAIEFCLGAISNQDPPPIPRKIRYGASAQH